MAKPPSKAGQDGAGNQQQDAAPEAAARIAALTERAEKAEASLAEAVARTEAAENLAVEAVNNLHAAEERIAALTKQVEEVQAAADELAQADGWSTDQAASMVGIEPDQVFAHRLYDDRVVVVTVDGRKLEALL